MAEGLCSFVWFVSRLCMVAFCIIFASLKLDFLYEMKRVEKQTNRPLS